MCLIHRPARIFVRNLNFWNISPSRSNSNLLLNSIQSNNGGWWWVEAVKVHHIHTKLTRRLNIWCLICCILNCQYVILNMWIFQREYGLAYCFHRRALRALALMLYILAMMPQWICVYHGPKWPCPKNDLIPALLWVTLADVNIINLLKRFFAHLFQESWSINVLLQMFFALSLSLFQFLLYNLLGFFLVFMYMFTQEDICPPFKCWCVISLGMSFTMRFQ